jgi:hypothetical protein
MPSTTHVPQLKTVPRNPHARERRGFSRSKGDVVFRNQVVAVRR